MNMRRRSIVVIAALVAAVSALLFVILRKGTRAASETSELAVPPRGREAVLHFTWHEKSTARLRNGEAAGVADTFQGELDLEADLALSRETTIDGGDAVRAELRDVRTARAVVMGHEVIEAGEAGRKSLEGKPIHLVMEDGRIARVLVPRDASSVTVQLVESVARQVLLGRPKAGTFEREEQVPAGVMRVQYEPKGDAHRRTVLSAVSLANLPDRCEGPCVQHARGEGEVRFEDDNVVLRFSEKRELRAGVPAAPAMLESTATFEATRVKEGSFDADALDPTKLASKLPGELFENEAEKHAALARRAEGATIEDILGGIGSAATSGPEAMPKGWLVRSTALLELHPELLAEVAIRFEDESLGSRGRLAVLDVLAATGGNEAKTALLRVLDSSAARHDDLRLTYLQRLMLVEEPNTEMSRAVRDRHTQSVKSNDSEMAYAEAHVMGAMAGTLAARGERGEAKASLDVLGGALEGAKTPAARAAYLSALGNAGDRSQVSRIKKHAKDEDPAVRRAVASALRKTDDPEARSTLMSLASDADEDVQVAAVDALGHSPPSPSEQRELARMLEAPKLGGETEARVVTLLLRQGPPSAEVRGSLEQLLAHTEDPRLAARVRLALEASSPN
jgi:HEAT repeat protein